jgi:hypothetical protein
MSCALIGPVRQSRVGRDNRFSEHFQQLAYHTRHSGTPVAPQDEQPRKPGG